VAVFVESNGDWRPAYAGRASAFFRIPYAEAAIRLLGPQSLLHLARGDSPQDLWTLALMPSCL
ncbi:MAG: hypothetical protein MI741_15015, partial [Rhodospirillales bacterium]|nr:hypothetical protein [Rhodospirillales bacterium]